MELSAELEPKATIVKFNCNQHNKELAKALGIKVAPTFHLYRNGTKVADMTGNLVGNVVPCGAPRAHGRDTQQQGCGLSSLACRMQMPASAGECCLPAFLQGLLDAAHHVVS